MRLRKWLMWNVLRIREGRTVVLAASRHEKVTWQNSKNPAVSSSVAHPRVAFRSSGMGRQDNGDPARAAGEHGGFGLLLLVVVVGHGGVAGELFLGVAAGLGGGTLAGGGGGGGSQG